MKTPEPFKLGDTLRDAVSGYQGIAVNRTDFLTGNQQFTLERPFDPKVKDGSVDTRVFDSVQLDYTCPGFSGAVAEPEVAIKLGEKVKCIITGHTGIAVRKVAFLNGCVYFTVVSPSDKTGKSLEDFIEHKCLTRVGAGVTALIAKRMAASDTPTGGPAYNVPQRG